MDLGLDAATVAAALLHDVAKELPTEEPKTFDNKQFYIWGSVIAAVALLLTFLIK